MRWQCSAVNNHHLHLLLHLHLRVYAHLPRSSHFLRACNQSGMPHRGHRGSDHGWIVFQHNDIQYCNLLIFKTIYFFAYLRSIDFWSAVISPRDTSSSPPIDNPGTVNLWIVTVASDIDNEITIWLYILSPRFPFLSCHFSYCLSYHLLCLKVTFTTLPFRSDAEAKTDHALGNAGAWCDGGCVCLSVCLYDCLHVCLYVCLPVSLFDCVC